MSFGKVRDAKVGLGLVLFYSMVFRLVAIHILGCRMGYELMDLIILKFNGLELVLWYYSVEREFLELKMVLRFEA